MANAHDLLMAQRAAMMSKSGYTAKDYVQDGLIAMWDGIENAGWGVHDPNATVWDGLITGNRITGSFGSSGRVWTGDSMRFDVPLQCSYVFEGSVDDYTIEAVFSVPDKDPANKFAWIFAYGSLRFCSLKQNRQITMFLGGISDFQISGLTFPTGRVSVSFKRRTNGANYEYKTYKDGSNVNTRTNSIAIGIGSASSTLSNSNPIGFELCNLRIYNRPLADSEVSENYTIDKARFNLPG